MPYSTQMIQRLIDRRAELVGDSRTILDLAVTEDRDLTDDELGHVDRLDQEINTLSDRIDQLESDNQRAAEFDAQRARYEERLARERQTATATQTDDTPTTGDMFRRLASGEIRSFTIDLRHAQPTVDTRSGVWAVESRDLDSTTANAGGETIPTGFVRRLYEHMIESSGIRQTNATVLTTETGEPLEFPKTLTHPGAGSEIAEGDLIPENDPTFDKVTLNAYKYGSLVDVPIELLTDTGVDLEGYLSRRMGQAIGNAAGARYVLGTGSGQPQGVAPVATVGVTGGTGVAGAFTADNIIDLFYSVIEAYANRGFWLLRRTTEGAARKLKGSDNNYLWQPGLQVGSPNLLLGRPIVSDPNVAAVATSARSVLFGDFSPFIVRDVAGVTVARSDDAKFESDLVVFKATLRTDSDLTDLTGAVKCFVGGAT